jgi:hypothetical protein
LEVAVHFALWLSVGIVAVSSVGCALSLEPAKFRTRGMGSFALPVWTADGMYLVTGRSMALFLTSSPLDLNRYRGVVLDEIRITTKNRSRDLKPNEEERLRGYFTRRLNRVFEHNGWPIVDTPGEDVLRVRLAVKGVELERWNRHHFGNIVLNSSTDSIAIVLEFRDAEKNERMMLFGENRNLPPGVYSGSDSVSIRRVEDAFDDFSKIIRQRLTEVQRGAFPPPPRPS